MLGYIDTVGNFINTSVLEILSYLKDTYPDAEESQVNSWMVLINDIKSSPLLLEINPDLIISIEYSLSVENMAIDVFFVGCSNSLENIVYIIEAKQWSSKYIYENDFSNYREDDRLLHPQIQVSRHVHAMKDYLSIGSKINSFKPFVYIKNADNLCCADLMERNVEKDSSEILILNNLDSVFNFIKCKLVNPPTVSVDDFRNATYFPSLSIIDTMHSIVNKEIPFILNQEQENTVVTILKAIKHGKKIIRIKGAAGSGKTAILLNVYVKMLLKQSAYTPYFVSGSQNTALYRSLYPEVVNCFSFSFNLKDSIVKARVKKPIILMDEGQQNESGIITELLDLDSILILCYDERQVISANNSLKELKALENRQDFVSIELDGSVRFNGSSVYERNVRKLLQGDLNFESDDKYDFKICNTLKEIEIKTKYLMQSNPDITVAVIGLLSDDADEIAKSSDGFIFTDWSYKKESEWIPYVNDKNYLSKNNGSIWAGTWWMPGLDVDYVVVIAGNDVIMTKKGLVGDPYHSKNYKMIISVALELNFPKSLFSSDSNLKKVKNILNYIDLLENKDIKEKFISRFSDYLNNMYYIMMTRGRKGCYVFFNNISLD